jgi:hypothetical protein
MVSRKGVWTTIKPVVKTKSAAAKKTKTTKRKNSVKKTSKTPARIGKSLVAKGVREILAELAEEEKNPV